MAFFKKAQRDRYMTYLIDQSLRQSIVPSSWKMALVTHIFKTGEWPIFVQQKQLTDYLWERLKAT